MSYVREWGISKYSNMFINIELTLTYTLFRTRKRRYARPIIAYKEHKTFFHNPIFQLDGQQTEEPCFIWWRHFYVNFYLFKFSYFLRYIYFWQAIYLHRSFIYILNFTFLPDYRMLRDNHVFIVPYKLDDVNTSR